MLHILYSSEHSFAACRCKLQTPVLFTLVSCLCPCPTVPRWGVSSANSLHGPEAETSFSTSCLQHAYVMPCEDLSRSFCCMWGWSVLGLNAMAVLFAVPQELWIQHLWETCFDTMRRETYSVLFSSDSPGDR